MADKYEVQLVGHDKLSGVLRNVASASGALNTAAAGARTSVSNMDSAMEKTAKNTSSISSWTKLTGVLNIAAKGFQLIEKASMAMSKNSMTEGMYGLEMRLRAMNTELADYQTNLQKTAQLRDIAFSKKQATTGTTGGTRDLGLDVEDSAKALDLYKEKLTDVQTELGVVNDKWKESYDAIANIAGGAVDKLPDKIKGSLGDMTTALTGLGIGVSNILKGLGGKETLDALDQQRARLMGQEDALKGIVRAEEARKEVLTAQSDAQYEMNRALLEKNEIVARQSELGRAAERAAIKAASIIERSGGRVKGWSIPGSKGSQEEGREARREMNAENIANMSEEKRDEWYDKILAKEGRGVRLSKKEQEAKEVTESLRKNSTTDKLRDNATAAEKREFAKNVDNTEKIKAEKALRELSEFLLKSLKQE